MPIELGALNQTHHRRRTLSGTQGTGEQPVISPNGNWSNLILNPVVIDWQLSIIVWASK